MVVVELVIVLLAIWLGARLGGIGIGFAGGLGVLALTLICGLKPGAIPFDVIEIIMAVIAAIAAMQIAGGLDYLVGLAERLLRRHPRYVTFLAPLVTYVMTLLAGTGHTAFSTLPVIAEVAKEQGVRPSRPLSIAVVASQIAITASPLSAAVVFFASILEPRGVSYLALLGVAIPSTMAAIFCAAIITSFLGKELKDDEVYQARLAKGEVKLRGEQVYDIKPGAKRAVFLFLIGIAAVVLYATAISDSVGLITNPVLPRNEAIVVFMLTVATLICLTCKVDTGEILSASTFKSGMSACICVMGVAWLGDTFVKAHLNDIQALAGDMLQGYPWMLALVLFFAATLLYSQAATTKALMPAALMLGVSPLAAVASFAAVSALFVLPTYPTLLAAVEMDDTGSTRIGKFVFNHSFIIPGVLAIAFSVAFGFLFGSLIL
ncbi:MULTISPECIES: anaerobic C4-dicarboxylate transporter [Enterobacterales]|jgi:anaerobic C4-dicarboxylate transporter DcuA|uniref:anaerobic C4-dicarboxylate transporter n=2 Tax=Gammaproteobacteria TaxID=1236 RepID=UPI0012AE7BB1|nr:MULTISPECIES: anaerobic C4-dicarboxylate transporter [Enterobacterales]MRS20343.1 anaerobic C4-dicarboxylate transporter [Enterobacteriaceae bacterium RIT692]MRT41090.1 anaerobic C4-dicarboxylate transporter [Enterobacteriaceae bacterium RIT702]MBB3305992.1 anaerobic C4-dicarboxylate transporter DcuA [Enterobacter sp. Sphag1F]MEA5102113.1 anaerobic C4-dicarboxylate transporter [Pantoea sp. S18]NYI14660.1 anaerobic C4-dicarboxylate transporter DcuA [Enterobacter sp. Sphag71]